GAALPANRIIDGHDILPTAKGQAKSPHETIFWASGGQFAARRGYWKLVINGKTFDRTPEGKKALTGDDALFLSDLDDDIGETHNRRHDHAKLVEDLEQATYAWAKECERNR
ncbi:MAG: sulfatase-like hydrolase/transferase, partial [bacterium]